MRPTWDIVEQHCTARLQELVEKAARHSEGTESYRARIDELLSVLALRNPPQSGFRPKPEIVVSLKYPEKSE